MLTPQLDSAETVFGREHPEYQETAVLDELRLLVPEAEAWARAEGDARARAAVQKLRRESEGMQ